MSIKNIEGDQRPEGQKTQGAQGKGLTKREFLAMVGGAAGYFGISTLAGCNPFARAEQSPTATPRSDGTARAAADSTPTPKEPTLTPAATSLPKPTVVAMAEVQAKQADVTPTAISTRVEATQPARIEAPDATKVALVEENARLKAQLQATPKATETPVPTPAPEPTKVKEVVKNDIRLVNIKEKVESKDVDVARLDRGFKNTIGLGTEAFIAEPGGLLVGPDFGSKSKLNPYGYNPEGWDAMYNAGGSIKAFSAVNHDVVHTSGEYYQNLPEGGFVVISAGQMTIEIGEVKITLPYKKGNNYFFVARGVYPDGHQDTDQNRTVKLTDYKPGFVEVTMYESREKSNTAFVSEGQFLQKAGTSHSGGTSCGAEGCSGLTAVFYDANTGAVSIVEQSQGRFGNPKEGWKAVWSNWR